MYRCECCHREFEFPERDRELMGEFYVRVEACPYCHSDEIFQSIGTDAFDDFVYPGDTYYLLNQEMVLKDNIEKYLADCEVEA